MKPFILGLLVLFLQCAIIFVFVRFSSVLGALGKTTCIGAVPVLMIVFNGLISRATPVLRVVVCNILMAVGVVAFLQIIGFVWFPGLVKDVTPFSLQHMGMIGKLVGMVVVLYSFLMLAGHGLAFYLSKNKGTIS